LNLLLNEQMSERHIVNLCPNLTFSKADSWTSHIIQSHIMVCIFTYTQKLCNSVAFCNRNIQNDINKKQFKSHKKGLETGHESPVKNLFAV
jgi:hypothetical protein